MLGRALEVRAAKDLILCAFRREVALHDGDITDLTGAEREVGEGVEDVVEVDRGGGRADAAEGDVGFKGFGVAGEAELVEGVLDGGAEVEQGCFALGDLGVEQPRGLPRGEGADVLGGELEGGDGGQGVAEGVLEGAEDAAVDRAEVLEGEVEVFGEDPLRGGAGFEDDLSELFLDQDELFTGVDVEVDAEEDVGEVAHAGEAPGGA
jgi:hypothetical protein